MLASFMCRKLEMLYPDMLLLVGYFLRIRLIISEYERKMVTELVLFAYHRGSSVRK